MVTKTLVYFDEGDYCWGSHEITQADREDLYKTAKADGHIGFLSGYRYMNGEKESVIVFFHSTPSGEEIQRRRDNGLKGARWYSILEEEQNA